MTSTENPIDVITRAVEQGRGILACVAGAYDNDSKEHNVSGHDLNAALWAVQDAMLVIDTAIDKLIAERR